MIRLHKSTNIPATLTSQAVQNEKNNLGSMVGSGTYPSSANFKSNLYGAHDVRDQLKADQNSKCVFCESICKGEVEHYRPKTAVIQGKGGCKQIPAYYNLGYEWSNLTLCCHDCNNKKSDYFPLQNPNARFNVNAEVPLIINPYDEDPALHLEFRRNLLFPRNDNDGNEDPKGRCTIDYLDLNREDLKERRRRRLLEFDNNKKRLNLSFDAMLRQEIQDATNDGRTAESIEFFGMFTNQTYKF